MISEEEKRKIRSLSDKEFQKLDPSIKRNCATCAFLKGTLSLWCTNKNAIKDRGTGIPGIIFCPYWEKVEKKKSLYERIFKKFLV
jgi:hypothetical protein